MKSKTIFTCSECGYESAKWMGKCPACNSWNTMEEQAAQPEPQYASKGVSTGRATPVALRDVQFTHEDRMTSGIRELDRVLGGGIVRGSLVLVGGDPGIGKSTLLLQLAGTAGEAERVFYVSGEESEKQLKSRADRLDVQSDSLMVLSETNVDAVLRHVSEVRPTILVVDSVQTMYRPELTSAPGSVSQVRDVTMSFMKLAKEQGIAVFLVGHVTKDGAIAGPKVLEHMVDCVLYFEGERHQSYRILRAVKNRFGSTNEIGVFEMTGDGLCEVENPSSMLLEGRPADAPGSVVICTMEGTRPVLAEIQALVTPSGFGMARRMATGIDYNRVNLLIAVLEKRVGLNLQNQDSYVNITGGLRIDEPAADLGVAVAVASSFRNFSIPHDVAVIGEVGLTGELRAVSQMDKRLAEIYKLGFLKCVIPKANLKGLSVPDGITLLPAATLTEALKYLM